MAPNRPLDWAQPEARPGIASMGHRNSRLFALFALAVLGPGLSADPFAARAQDSDTQSRDAAAFAAFGSILTST